MRTSHSARQYNFTIPPEVLLNPSLIVKRIVSLKQTEQLIMIMITAAVICKLDPFKKKDLQIL